MSTDEQFWKWNRSGARLLRQLTAHLWYKIDGVSSGIGEQGPPGPQGPEGPAGPEGPTGPQGLTGPEGPLGPQGDQGPQGSQGNTGPQGSTGPQGDTGPQGPTGSQGPQGNQGPPGDTGPQGATGPQGPAGAGGQMVLNFQANAGANLTLTNQANTEQFLGNSNRNIMKVDLTGLTQCRLVTRVVTASASVNTPRVYLEYHTAFTTTVGTYQAIGATAVNCSLSSAGVTDSGWIDLVAGAKADVFVTVLQNGGDGAADPALGMTVAYFK